MQNRVPWLPLAAKALGKVGIFAGHGAALSKTGFLAIRRKGRVVIRQASSNVCHIQGPKAVVSRGIWSQGQWVTKEVEWIRPGNHAWDTPGRSRF